MKRADILSKYCVQNEKVKNIKYRRDWVQYVLPVADKNKIDASATIDDILYKGQ